MSFKITALRIQVNNVYPETAPDEFLDGFRAFLHEKVPEDEKWIDYLSSEKDIRVFLQVVYMAHSCGLNEPILLTDDCSFLTVVRKHYDFALEWLLERRVIEDGYSLPSILQPAMYILHRFPGLNYGICNRCSGYGHKHCIREPSDSDEVECFGCMVCSHFICFAHI